MSDIKTKRDDLVRFIREQTEGPGAYGFRYVDIEKIRGNEINLDELYPLNYQDEIIPTIPAEVYSTAILFPLDKSDTAGTNLTSGSGDEDTEDDGTSGNDEKDLDEKREALSINQTFPNNIAITFGLTPGIKIQDIDISLSARYYSKLTKSESASVFLVLDQSIDDFECFREKFGTDTLLFKKLKIKNEQNKLLLQLLELRKEEIASLRQDLITFSKEQARFLGSEIEGQTLDGYKSYIYHKLRRNEPRSRGNDELIKKLTIIERFENSIIHIKDLLILSSKGSYGLWRSKLYNTPITIPEEIPKNLKGKKVYSFKEYSQLRGLIEENINGENDKAILSANIQVSRDSRNLINSPIYFKVQLVNESVYEQDKEDSRYYSAYNEKVNKKSFFGAMIRVKSKFLVPFNQVKSHEFDKKNFDENDSTRLIYRQFVDYGIGHNCSVDWSIDGDDKCIHSEFIPSHDVPDIEPIPRNKKELERKGEGFIPQKVFEDFNGLNIKWLSTLSNAANDEILDALKSFLNAYEEWISDKRNEYKFGEFEKISKHELNKCEDDLRRMKKNLELLRNEVDSLYNFRLMNSTIFIQMWHTVKRKRKSYFTNLFSDKKFMGFDEQFYKENAEEELFRDNMPVNWRPFQLAFILLNLDGLIEPEDIKKWDIRNNVTDLIWFPTGGGKTEAYLGLLAFSIIYRRRKYGLEGGGTAAFLRYTLRLLTLQQFQRATTMIMALELIRRWGKTHLGEEPIYIGLWVGKGSLPNTFKELEDELEELKKATQSNKLISTKIPISDCPWCGEKLFNEKFKFYEEKDKNAVFMYHRYRLRCPNPKCSFFFIPGDPSMTMRKDQGPLPLSLCDEEIYLHPPTLLFGTVDKFAQLAHKFSDKKNERHKDSRRLFGRGNWEQGKPSLGYLPPDLIIQDELHLLQGPLGSAVALFESAIDYLTKRADGTKPKVISSTATIRNTELQVAALFNRMVNIFPKPGVDCDDSFFAFYKRTYKDKNSKEQYLSKRKYLGMLPTGKTPMWFQMRLAAILLVHRAKFENTNRAANAFVCEEYNKEFAHIMDNYQTVVSYFNSLKEVGKTESQVHTYLLKEVRRVYNRVLRPGKILQPIHTYSIKSEELTGRLSGEQVKTALENVSNAYNIEQRFLSHSYSSPPDFVIATNMISVGIDISRLNLMLVNSMPRNVAEYIQATSRVARDDLGIIITMHHPYRTRDVSYFEKFREFHEKLYAYVEPISVTPFTKKVLDLYLGLYLATNLRTFKEFVERDDAAKIYELSEKERSEIINNLLSYFISRKNVLYNYKLNDDIKELLTDENIEMLKEQISRSIKGWFDLASECKANGNKLVFENALTNKGQCDLFRSFTIPREHQDHRKLKVPHSLRIVEPQAVINIENK